MTSTIRCGERGHEFVGNYRQYQDEAGNWRIRDDADEPNVDGLDYETHRVRILAPQEAVDAEPDTECCTACAAKVASACVGNGWDVDVRRLDRED